MNIRRLTLLLAILLLAGTAHGKVVTQAISYTHGGVSLEGYLAYDDAVSGKAPGVLVVHEWWGLNDYARSRAEKLAHMGVVAFALDMYGKGKSTEHPDQAAAWMKAVNGNMDGWLKRAMAGLEVLKKQPMVDAGRLAAIGYCFGGATVQVLAYGGADIKGVVSFHGSLMPPTAEQAARTRAKILICHGAADPMNQPEAMSTYAAAMNASSIDWQMIAYGGTRHSFTNPDADKRDMAALAYSPSADRRSWQHMTFFFEELF
ncbi:dienelactone hydrolase [Desulfosarcina alkanivorans]|uniref:Dienelactone hydrolase n=1 Tax=Desulfosarcina alkanivorans TaxID=571177 RepID=A0A5K7YRN2_9BACT|nr:dienelactone hydrolase family protein [Desulfosarcina alkanivorans]BBO68944.1 dienelactone hydrolase [Desulfosarcina alkanivorans]